MTVGGLAAVTYGYNGADQLTSVARGSTSVSLAYDPAGRPRTVTLPNGIVETYSYDDASELTGITYTSGSTTLGDLSYGYDQAGRRTAAWGGFARTGLPTATTQAASYNANNRLTAWNGTSLTYDPNGDLTAFGSQTFAWNDRNQLASTTGGAASFAYDGLGRRVTKTVGGTTTKYLYDGANVVQEQDSSNVATANLLTGLGIDQVFSRTDAAGETSFLTDALGSTIALADTSGVIQTSYTYEPFGAATSTGASSTNRFQFTGRENDGASGLYFYRARYYGPTFGRFISEDPLGFPGGPDANLFAYVGNNPVSLIDPFGLDPGNGCGFLGLSCLGSFFSSIFSSISATVSSWHLDAADWASILGFVSVLASGVAIVAALAEMPLLLVILGVVSIGASVASTELTCKTEGFSSSCAAGIVGTAVNVGTFGVGSYAKAPLVRALAGILGYLSSLVTLRYQEQYGGTPLLGMANYQI